MTRRTAARGFTLLEVMVALAVLAGALMALADLSGNALRNYGYARDLSVATLLARAKMAEETEKLEDAGFRDFDQTEDGNFSDQGYPSYRWKLEVMKPDSSLTAEKMLAGLLGAGPDDADAGALIGQLLGTGKGGGGATSGLPGGAAGGLLQGQITTFVEELKKSVRRVRLTVSWKDGKTEHAFDVSTVLVVLNPRAPGGAHGAEPDIPPSVGGVAPSFAPGVQNVIRGATTGGKRGQGGTK